MSKKQSNPLPPLREGLERGAVKPPPTMERPKDPPSLTPPKKTGEETMKGMLFKFELGEILKDVVTGFKGVAMGRTQYYTDCNHYGLCPRKLDKGKIPEWTWFDETRLVGVKEKRVVLNSYKPKSGVFPKPPNQ